MILHLTVEFWDWINSIILIKQDHEENISYILFYWRDHWLQQ